MSATKENLDQMLAWSEPQNIQNVRGSRITRTASPTHQFWGLWRSNKTGLKDLGISVVQRNGEWLVIWYQDAPSTPVAPDLFSLPVAKPTAVRIDTQPVVQTGGRQWSAEQEKIFSWFKTKDESRRALVVRARAGTGKTTTIKAAFELAPEASMLYAVFNKKNQVEAASAISDPRVSIKTLHSLGFAFIKQVWPNARPTDEVESDRIDSVLPNGTHKEIKTAIRRLVAFAKNTFIDPTVTQLEEMAVDRDIECPNFESMAYGGWTRFKLSEHALMALNSAMIQDEQGRISYNDMVWLPVRMGWVRPCFDLVVVDEAQDMNVPQLTMAKKAVRADGRICVVGDDRQAIYGFRGAASDGIDMMVKELNAYELGLTTTYRCPKSVVKLAAVIVEDYKAASTAPEGVVEYLPNIDSVTVGDAILSRSNAPLMPLCLQLLRRGVRARIEGKDLGKELLRLVQRLNASTVPQFLQKLEAHRERMTARYASSRNFEAKCDELDDQVATLRAIVEGVSGVSEIETRLTNLFADSDTDKAPKVTLSSVHKAKGLEWAKVYIISKTFNRRRAAHAAPMAPQANLEMAKEESNIYYVALTRAKSHLVLVTEDVV